MIESHPGSNAFGKADKGTVDGITLFTGIQGLMVAGDDDGSACRSADGTHTYVLGTFSAEVCGAAEGSEVSILCCADWGVSAT